MNNKLNQFFTPEEGKSLVISFFSRKFSINESDINCANIIPNQPYFYVLKFEGKRYRAELKLDESLVNDSPNPELSEQVSQYINYKTQQKNSKKKYDESESE